MPCRPFTGTEAESTQELLLRSVCTVCGTISKKNRQTAVKPKSSPAIKTVLHLCIAGSAKFKCKLFSRLQSFRYSFSRRILDTKVRISNTVDMRRELSIQIHFRQQRRMRSKYPPLRFMYKHRLCIKKRI